jgi:E3 ubiquitin-protein ligase DOA10
VERRGIADLISAGYLQKTFNPEVFTSSSECMICYVPYETEEDFVTVLPCNETHYFHTECISTWVKDGNNVCPLCRKEITKEEIE